MDVLHLPRQTGARLQQEMENGGGSPWILSAQA
jgi:hypothetical protein